MDNGDSLSDRAAEEIRAMLGRKRVTGRELARRLDVSSPWVSQRLTGHTEIGLNDLEKIARALDVDVADLLPQPATRHGGRSESPPRFNSISAAPGARPRTRQLTSPPHVNRPASAERTAPPATHPAPAPRSRPRWTCDGVTA